MLARRVKTGMVVAGAALAALSCDKSATPLYPGVSSFCTVTLSGAVTGTYNCRSASVVWSSADSTGTFAFVVSASGTAPGIAVTVSWPNEPTTRTYANSDSAAAAVLAVVATGQTWQASVGGSSAAAGSYALVFTSVVNNLREQNGNLYATEGTLTASLPAVAASGATGTVTLSAAF